MSITRIIHQEETEVKDESATILEDRLSNLPESLKLCILSSLNLKNAVQTMVLSKSWVSLWTLIPVLDLNHMQFDHLHVFDEFVDKVLSLRDQSVKLERLTFTRGGICSAKNLKKIFDYAFSQGVKELETWISVTTYDSWPVCSLASTDLITSLRLDSHRYVGCPILGPITRSGTFGKLTVLHLRGAIINDLDPFSGFPALQKLTLINCHVNTDGKTLNVQALQLLYLEIFCYQRVECCELTTPKLRFFEYQGFSIPLFKTKSQQGLPVLETVVIDLQGVCRHKQMQKITFDDLMR